MSRVPGRVFLILHVILNFIVSACILQVFTGYHVVHVIVLVNHIACLLHLLYSFAYLIVFCDRMFVCLACFFP